MSQYHKFNIGDVVEVQFEGEVEGEKVFVTKKLFVIGVWLEWNIYSNPPRWDPNYRLTESIQSHKDKQWDLLEGRLTSVEPMLGEMKKVRDKSCC